MKCILPNKCCGKCDNFIEGNITEGIGACLITGMIKTKHSPICNKDNFKPLQIIKL